MCLCGCKRCIVTICTLGIMAIIGIVLISLYFSYSTSYTVNIQEETGHKYVFVNWTYKGIIREKPEGVSLWEVRTTKQREDFIQPNTIWNLIDIDSKKDFGDIKVDDKVVVASGKKWEAHLKYTLK